MGEGDVVQLYGALRDAIFLFANRRLRVEQAEDVVGETFEVVWRKRGDAPADRRAWPAWCFGIAKYQVLQERQRVARKHHDHRLVSEGDWISEVQDDVADAVTTVAMGQWVWRELTPDERILANLLLFSETNVSEAARIVGISGTAYTNRVFRLRRRIEELSKASDTGTT